MPVCDICCEELLSEADVKTHLLLSHLENEITCPFCSLSGVSYDELSFHINTAHVEDDCQVIGATVVDSSQRTSNGLPKCEINSTRTSTSKNSLEACRHNVSQPLAQSSFHSTPSQVNEMATPNTGATLSQKTLSRVKSSPPAADTASGVFKPVRSTQPLSNCKEKSCEKEQGHRKSKQMRLSSPNKGDFSMG